MLLSRPGATHAVVVPVKPLSLAKTRLGDLGAERRRSLAEAFAADTLAACAQASSVGLVVVVTDDPVLRTLALDEGHELVLDPGAGLNEAMRTGVEHAHTRAPNLRPASLCGDLPALAPHELDRALGLVAQRPGAWFVADWTGWGTTLLAAEAPAAFLPRFGPGSAQAHRTAGAQEVVAAALDGLRHDVDTAEDLDRVRSLGLGPSTTAVLEGLHES